MNATKITKKTYFSLGETKGDGDRFIQFSSTSTKMLSREEIAKVEKLLSNIYDILAPVMQKK